MGSCEGECTVVRCRGCCIYCTAIDQGQHTVDMGYRNPLEVKKMVIKIYHLLKLTVSTLLEFRYAIATIDLEHAEDEDFLK